MWLCVDVFLLIHIVILPLYAIEMYVLLYVVLIWFIVTILSSPEGSMSFSDRSAIFVVVKMFTFSSSYSKLLGYFQLNLAQSIPVVKFD